MEQQLVWTEGVWVRLPQSPQPSTDGERGKVSVASDLKCSEACQDESDSAEKSRLRRFIHVVT